MSSWRRISLLIVLMIVFFGLFIRLFHLQIVQGRDFRELADSNRIQVKIIHAPRGVIYDRNGKILAQNEPGFRLVSATDSSKKASHISREEYLKMDATNDPRLKDLEIDSLRDYPYGEKTSH